MSLKIYRRLQSEPETANVLIATLPDTDTVYGDSGLAPETSYVYTFQREVTGKTFEPVEFTGTTATSFEYYLFITSPTEGQQVKEGESVLLSVSAVDGSATFTIEEADYVHLITYGQSLSAGAETTPGLSNTQVGGNLQLNFSSDPTAPPDLNAFIPLVVSTEQQEAIAAPWANALKVALQRDAPGHVLNAKTLIAHNTGTGGRTVTQLSGGTEYNKFSNHVEWVRQVAANLGKKVTCPAIVYMQGETEDSGTKEAYKTNLLSLFAKMRQTVQEKYVQAKPPTFIVYQPKNPAPQYVADAYYELADEYEWIVQAGPIYPVPNRGLHLDPNGSRWYGETIAKAMVKTMASGVKYEPLKPVAFEVSGNSVIVTYNRAIVLDTTARSSYTQLYGFQLTNNIQQSLTVSGNQVTIVSSVANLSGYGTLNLVYRNGAIRDADTYQATTLYTDYVDTAGANPVQNHTRDAQGNIIYGQYYPMWAWSMEFTKNLQ